MLNKPALAMLSTNLWGPPSSSESNALVAAILDGWSLLESSPVLVPKITCENPLKVIGVDGNDNWGSDHPDLSLPIPRKCTVSVVSNDGSNGGTK
jgi:hypothetical protein